MHELILGGQKSGKSRTAESRAARWLQRPDHEAVLIATALPGDGEMTARIARHRTERARRVPRLATREEPHALAAALRQSSAAHRMVVVDCLTLWLTQLLLPLQGPSAAPAECQATCQELAQALRQAPGPVVLVSNEIGLGLSPLSPQAREFVDTLGALHQSLAAVCQRVTLMVAGCEWPVKNEPS